MHTSRPEVRLTSVHRRLTLGRRSDRLGLVDTPMLTVDTHKLTWNKVDIGASTVDVGASIRPIRTGRHDDVDCRRPSVDGRHQSVNHRPVVQSSVPLLYVFYLEFSATLGFGLPKTDCCNECTVFIATKKEARKQLDCNLFLQTEALHDAHLKITHDRRDQMEIDMRAMEFNNPQTTNVILKHNQSTLFHTNWVFNLCLINLRSANL